MSYLVAADFREASHISACAGLTLTDDEANDTRLTAQIATLSQRVDDLTNDHFESATKTFDLDSWAPSDRLYLPWRCTAITTVKTRDAAGTLTLQDSSVFRLRSSLDPTGSLRQGDLDYLDIIHDVTGGAGLTSPYVWVWPLGPQTTQVVGTFGWTVTPGDAKRLLALLVWHHFKELRADLRRAEIVQTPSETVRYVSAEGGTGIPEADGIIANLRRVTTFGIG